MKKLIEFTIDLATGALISLSGAVALFITFMVICMLVISCGPTKREVEAKQGIPESVIRYSGHYKLINDSTAKFGYFIYERHRSNSGEYRFYCVNPIRQ